MNSILDAVSYKHVLAVTFAAMCLVEIRGGFLKPLKSYAASLSAKPSLLLIAAAFAGFLLVLPFDLFILAKIQSLQYPLLDRLIYMGAMMGKANGLWGPLAGLYFLSLCLRLKKSRDLFFGAVLSSALTGLTAHVLKFIVMRARPYNDFGPFRFFDLHGFLRDDRAFQSFPSGDVAIAAGAAAFLFLNFRRFYFSWLLLIPPVLTAFSRIDLNKHWPSDALFAFLISFTVAQLTLDYFKYSRELKA